MMAAKKASQTLFQREIDESIDVASITCPYSDTSRSFQDATRLLPVYPRRELRNRLYSDMDLEYRVSVLDRTGTAT